MKILFLTNLLPYLLGDGSKLRVYELLRGLAEHHEITLLSSSDQLAVKPEWRYTHEHRNAMWHGLEGFLQRLWGGAIQQ